jgi:hypothetical protein
MNCAHKWNGDVCTECGSLWRVWAEKEIARLRALIEPAKRALAVVSQFKMCVLSPEEFFMEICGKLEPIAQLQELYDALAKALEPFEDKQPGCGHLGVNT